MALEYQVIIDNKEQKPLEFKNSVSKHMKTGDYSILYRGIDYSNKIALERKSIADLISTLSSGHKRFKKELERALNLEYFAIIIEGPYFDVLHKNYSGARFSKMPGYTITSILFTLHVKYDINVFFAQNRNESKAIMQELMRAYLKQKEREKDEKNQII
jgi:ERCC4-type nuclease